jgi:hypothetical protein
LVVWSCAGGEKGMKENEELKNWQIILITVIMDIMIVGSIYIGITSYLWRK